jgi:acyl transferase domain-containing protein
MPPTRRPRFERPSPWALKTGRTIGHPRPFMADEPNLPAAPPAPDRDLAAVVELIERLQPQLGGLPPFVIGAALVELMATWLAGHVVIGDLEQTRMLREQLLSDWSAAVRKMIPQIAAELGLDP